MNDADILALADRRVADLTTASGTYDPTSPAAHTFAEEIARVAASLGPDDASVTAALDGMVRPMRPTPYRVVFWSQRPRAGRTTALLNIAYSLGRADRSVVLVDCNPALGNVGLSSNWPPGTRGLSDLVLDGDGGDPREHLQRRLFGEMEIAVLPIGTRAAELAEAAGTTQFPAAIRAVLGQLDADYLLIDGPTGRSPLALTCVQQAQSIVACLWLGPADIAETMASRRIEPLTEEEMRATVHQGEEALEALDLMAADRPAHTHVFVQEARFAIPSPYDVVRAAIRRDFYERLYEVTQRMSPRLRDGAPPCQPIVQMGLRGHLLDSNGRLSPTLRENVADALTNIATWLEDDRQKA